MPTKTFGAHFLQTRAINRLFVAGWFGAMNHPLDPQKHRQITTSSKKRLMHFDRSASRKPRQKEPNTRRGDDLGQDTGNG
mmetsp:Transcript_31529/g.72537  ORF Transcript_31529/g.72537 Transcript_31529/m.72537 type:complete len:80 (-) Transcript_31529:89-328(-)